MVDFFDPTREIETKRLRAYAARMMEAGKQPTSTEMVSGYAVPVSPLASLARALQTGYGGYEETQADNSDKETAKARQKLYTDAFSKAQGEDYRGAAASLAQDPASMDSAFKMITAGNDADKNAKEQQMLAIALGQYNNKQPTTNPAAFGNSLVPSLSPSVGPLPLGGSTNKPTGADYAKFMAPSPVSEPVAAPPATGTPADLNGVLDQEKLRQDAATAQPMPFQAPSGGQQAPLAPATPPNGAPISVGGLPVTQNMPEGTMAALGPDGKPGVMNLPNLDAKKSIDTHLSTINDLIDKLDANGAVVSPDKSVLQNVASRIGNSNDATILGHGVVPGGQTIGEYVGTKNQTNRDQIKQEINRMMFDYMRAAGLTPGMERTVQAQQMVREAVGNLDMSGPALKEGLKRLSQQLGNGALVRPQAPNQNSSAPIDVPAGWKYLGVKK